MPSEQEIRSMVEGILAQMASGGDVPLPKAAGHSAPVKGEVSLPPEKCTHDEGELDDISAVDLRKQFLVPNPVDKQGYLKMKEYTPARLGIWRAGDRYKTETMLRFRADHAAAQDAVFSYVSEEYLQGLDLIHIETLCKDKDEYLTRPDLGRRISEETAAFLKKEIPTPPKVQIVLGDGLSSSAVEANAKDIIPSVKQGLSGFGIETGRVIFVKHCRVGVMDAISEAVGAEVTLLLVGERPGLITAESMSAYIAYKATIGMGDARRTVVSNIHNGGTPAVEAGAHIAQIIKRMLEEKASGVELKL